MKDMLFLELDSTMREADIVLDHLLINGLTDIGKKLMPDLIVHLKNVIAVHGKLKAFVDEQDQLIVSIKDKLSQSSITMKNVLREVDEVTD
jgi:hypothetical protein